MEDDNKDLLKSIIVGGAALAGAMILGKSMGGGNGYTYIACSEKFWQYEGEFNCPKCKRKVKIRTGDGRYGLLGHFNCPHCKAKLFAEIDDNINPDIRIYKEKDMPSGLLDNHKHGYITIHPHGHSK